MKFHKSSGQVSRVLIILGVVLILAAVIVYFGIRFAANKKTVSNTTANTTTQAVEPPAPVYDVTVGDLEFHVISALDLGSVLIDNKSGYHQNLTTTEKFIEVTITAQNKGKVNSDQYVWSLGNIVDSDGRVFNQIGNAGYYFQPQPDLCGALLKPEFAPTPCTRIYEVAKISTKLAVQIIAPLPKGQTTPIYLDLHVK